jgi:hypothetical protein
LPSSDLTDAGSAATLAHGAGFRASRTADGIVLEFPVLRAPAAAMCLGAFSAICGLMPAIGLSALLSAESASASMTLSLALIGGFAAPFILASVVFLVLAIYLRANSLRVEINADGIRTERRVFGRITRSRGIARGDVAEIEPRIGARYQNVFSSTPRYALIAKHRTERLNDVVVAEDLAGQALMVNVRSLICTALGK